jgi:hypothetical protein
MALGDFIEIIDTFATGDSRSYLGVDSFEFSIKNPEFFGFKLLISSIISL